MRYKTLLQYGEAEYIVEKSRFIGYVQPVEKEDEAIEFIESIRGQHRTATHNVPVYILGRNNGIQRYSDDGEPAGTAGVPVLEMLKKEGIKNVVIVITRYFGGVKLGTGGLVRAYTSTAKLALKKGRVIEKVLHDLIKARIDYSILGKVQNEVHKEGYVLKETVFDDAANMYIYCDKKKTNQCIQMITNLTSGEGETQIKDTLYLNVDDGIIIQ